jgi:trk system potassium uptake protein TrkH
MSKPIFANLGFLLQIAGLLTILPIGIGLYFGETDTLISVFLVCVAFLGCGFLCNALCERKDLNFKSSNVLFLAAFILLPLIGAIPYVYGDPFNSVSGLERFTNSYFESISGYSTTGFSFVVNADVLPKSLLVYRSLTELIGGVGIVFLLLAFFQSRKAMGSFGNALGVDSLSSNLKRVFFSVLAIYGGYIIVFTIIFYALGFTDLIKTGTFIVDTLTGGFQAPAQQFQQYLSLVPKILIIALMFLGSVNFALNYHLFTRKLKKVISPEIALYFLIIAVGTAAVVFTARIEVIDSLFHVVSMSSSTGYDYITISSLNSTALSIFILLMLVGGCAFSMAGGIRVSRLITFAKSIKQGIKDLLIKEKVIPESEEQKEAYNHEYLPALISILLFTLTLVIFAILFTTMPPGVSFTDALFEVGSALTTNGISMGATTVSMSVGYKWLMIVAMTIGRIELMSVLVALIPFKVKGQQWKTEETEEQESETAPSDETTEPMTPQIVLE